MALHFVFTVDQDWLEYSRQVVPSIQRMNRYVENEIEFVRDHLNGRAVHLVHTSLVAGDAFLKPDHRPLLERVKAVGMDIGIHSHLDEPGKRYFMSDPTADHSSITRFAIAMREAGFSPVAHRGGYFSYCSAVTPVLKNAGIKYDFSCIPERHYTCDGATISDWRGVPHNMYQMDESDYKRTGSSGVWQVPVGYACGKHLYLDDRSLVGLFLGCVGLWIKSRREPCDVIAAVITHTYMFAPVGYSDLFPPLYNNVTKNRYLYKAIQVLGRVASSRPGLRALLRVKGFSLSALVIFVKFRFAVAMMKMFGTFIGIEELDRLGVHASGERKS